MIEIKRVPFGVPGLDELLQGGIPGESVVLITGTPGCAKTTLALQFIVNGAIKYGEKGVFITIEEGMKDLSEQFLEYGYDLTELQEQGKIKIIHPEVKVEEGGDFLQEITDVEFIKQIKEFGATRIAIDSLNLVLQFSGGYGGERREVEYLIHTYKKLGCTTIFTHERSTGGSNPEYGMEDFVVDGIIYLQLIRKEGVFNDKKAFFERRLTILKMRETDHGQGVYPFKIEKDGIHIY